LVGAAEGVAVCAAAAVPSNKPRLVQAMAMGEVKNRVFIV
jgi:hypothetical protein